MFCLSILLLVVTDPGWGEGHGIPQNSGGGGGGGAAPNPEAISGQNM